MRHFFHIIRPRPAAHLLFWAVAVLLAFSPEAGASIDTGPPAVSSSKAADRGPMASEAAVTPALDAGYGVMSVWSDASGQGSHLRGADAIRKRIPRRYRLSEPDAIGDGQALAQALLDLADAPDSFCIEPPHGLLLHARSDPRAPPRSDSA